MGRTCQKTRCWLASRKIGTQVERIASGGACRPSLQPQEARQSADVRHLPVVGVVRRRLQVAIIEGRDGHVHRQQTQVQGWQDIGCQGVADNQRGCSRCATACASPSRVLRGAITWRCTRSLRPEAATLRACHYPQDGTPWGDIGQLLIKPLGEGKEQREDAARLGVQDGDRVKVKSAIGEKETSLGAPEIR